MTDEEREVQIQRLAERFVDAPSRDEKERLWCQIKDLVMGRSQAQVARMERERGLA